MLICYLLFLTDNLIYFLVSAVGTLTPGAPSERCLPAPELLLRSQQRSQSQRIACFPENADGVVFACVAAARGAAAVRGGRQRSEGAAGGALCAAHADVGDAGEAAAGERAAGAEGRWPLLHVCLGEQLGTGLNPKGCFWLRDGEFEAFLLQAGGSGAAWFSGAHVYHLLVSPSSL